MRRLFFLLIFLCGNILLWSQPNTIAGFDNPSFEDEPRPAVAPKEWVDCGNESPPDIQPNLSFKVYQSPSDGASYMGMVTKETGSLEMVAQQMPRPLKAGKCYEFSIDLCKSASYQSLAKTGDAFENYDIPLVLKIWGGDDFCEKRELLGSTSRIDNIYWEAYSFNFQPKEDFLYLLMEVTFDDNYVSPPNGNMLLDNLSKIQLIDCAYLIPTVFIANPLSDEDITAQLEQLDINKQSMEMAQHIEFSESILRSKNQRLNRSSRSRMLAEVEVPDSVYNGDNDPYATIACYAKLIEFNRYNNLSKHLVVKEDGKQVVTNAGLFIIANSIDKIHKHERVIFAIKGYAQATRNGRVKRLQQAMRSLRVPWTRVTIGSYRAPERLNVDWLYENKYVSVGIEY